MRSPPFALLHFWFILLISSGSGKKSSDSHGVTLFVHNKCPFPIWPALAPNGGFPVIGEGGFLLPTGRTHRVLAPWKWTGRLWGRTACNFSSSGHACETGDCDGRLRCNGLAGTPPATLFQVSIRAGDTKLDYYDVSVVDGYNLPISVSARHANANAAQSCSINGCVKDLNAECPLELRVTSDSTRKVVACKSGCLAFNADAFCCRNEFGSSEKCGPSVYSKAFKEACPSYYSYAFDSPPPLVSCSAKEYEITFCPSGRGSVDVDSTIGIDVDI